jgi:hypothetical protein
VVSAGSASQPLRGDVEYERMLGELKKSSEAAKAKYE